jgi:hypothetical protein
MTHTARDPVMRRWSALVGAAAVVAGVSVAALRLKGVPGKGWRRAFWSAFAGVPRGWLGRVGTRVLAGLSWIS